MGFLYCSEMSQAFANHLLRHGPISVGAAANRYWRRHPKGYCTSDDDRKTNALMALSESACVFAERGLIEPSKRWCFVTDQLRDATSATEEDLNVFVEQASVEEFNRLLLKMNEEDVDGNYIWFDRIVWKLTQAGRTNPALLAPIRGVDL